MPFASELAVPELPAEPSSPLTFWQLVVETYTLIRAGVTRTVVVLWSLLFLLFTLVVIFKQ